MVQTLAAERRHRFERSLQIIADYKNGVAVDEIAASYEVSKSTVLRLVRSAGIPVRPRHFPEERRQAVLRDYAAGMSVKNIATKHSVSEAYVSTQAVRAGLRRKR